MKNGILVTFKSTAWSVRRNDRRITAKVASDIGLGGKIGVFYKYLIDPKDPYYRAVCNAKDKLYNTVQQYTLAWSHGVRLLNPVALDAFKEAIESQTEDYNAAVEALRFELPRLISEMRDRLTNDDTGASVFRESDYPSVEAICDAFSVSVNYSTLPDDAHFQQLADIIGPDIAQSMAADMVRDQRDQWTAANKSVWQRLFDALRKAESRLTTGTRMSGTHVQFMRDLQELADILPVLNIDNDSELEQRRQELVSVLKSYSPESVKDESNRQNCAAAVSDILAKIGAL